MTFLIIVVFKIQALKPALAIVTPNWFFGSINLKDAYCSIPVSCDNQGLLAFHQRNELYLLTSLENGLTSAQRAYTKVLKVVAVMVPKP